MFNVPPTAKVIWRRGHGLKVSPDRLVKPGIEPATPGLQGKRFIHYTTAAPSFTVFFMATHNYINISNILSILITVRASLYTVNNICNVTLFDGS